MKSFHWLNFSFVSKEGKDLHMLAADDDRCHTYERIYFRFLLVWSSLTCGSASNIRIRCLVWFSTSTILTDDVDFSRVLRVHVIIAFVLVYNRLALVATYPPFAVSINSISMNKYRRAYARSHSQWGRDTPSKHSHIRNEKHVHTKSTHDTQTSKGSAIIVVERHGMYL